jgi:hypothetical protein
LPRKAITARPLTRDYRIILLGLNLSVIRSGVIFTAVRTALHQTAALLSTKSAVTAPIIAFKYYYYNIALFDFCQDKKMNAPNKVRCVHLFAQGSEFEPVFNILLPAPKLRAVEPTALNFLYFCSIVKVG